MLTAAPLAYGTHAQDAVISSELVFISHANILAVEVLCGGLLMYRTWLSPHGCRGYPITVEISPFHSSYERGCQEKRFLPAPRRDASHGRKEVWREICRGGL